MPERKNEAAWIESRQRWQINVQREGERRTFTSSIAGKKGKIASEKKADAWLQSGLRDGSARLGAVWAAYLARLLALKTRESTAYTQAEYFGRLYILPRLEHRRLNTITPQMWQDVIDNAYVEKHLSRKTLKGLRGAMTAFFRYCRKCELDLHYPPDTLTIPSDAAVGERTILTPADLGVLFSQDTILRYGKPVPCHYIHAWRFCVITGLRPGELIALRQEDIVDGVLTVRGAVNVFGRQTRGKNANALRRFVLPAEAQAVLQDQRAYLRTAGILSPWIFPARDGGVSSEKSLYGQWQTYSRQHNLSVTSLYELRHTMVSLNAAVPDALLKPMVGHSANMDTRGIYGHAIAEYQQETAQLVDTALRRILQESAKKA